MKNDFSPEEWIDYLICMGHKVTVQDTVLTIMSDPHTMALEPHIVNAMLHLGTIEQIIYDRRCVIIRRNNKVMDFKTTGTKMNLYKTRRSNNKS